MILLFLAACLPEDQFREQSDDATCEWKSLCFEEDYDTCVADAVAAHGAEDETCTYDPDAAQLCVKGLRALECPADAEDPDEWGFPEACDEVWDCP